MRSSPVPAATAQIPNTKRLLAAELILELLDMCARLTDRASAAGDSPASFKRFLGGAPRGAKSPHRQPGCSDERDKREPNRNS